MVRLYPRSLNFRPDEQRFWLKIRLMGGNYVCGRKVKSRLGYVFCLIHRCKLILTAALLGGRFRFTRNERCATAGTSLEILRISSIAPWFSGRRVLRNWRVATSERRLISMAHSFIYRNPLRIIVRWRCARIIFARMYSIFSNHHHYVFMVNSTDLNFTRRVNV